MVRKISKVKMNMVIDDTTAVVIGQFWTANLCVKNNHNHLKLNNHGSMIAYCENQ